MNEFVTINPTKEKNDDQFAIIYLIKNNFLKARIFKRLL